MLDEVFIEELLKKGKEAKDQVTSEFSNISVEQLNWQPSPGGWSIAQCLDHLIKSDGSYFSALQRITEGIYKMKFLEKYSPFSHKWGQILKAQLQEKVKRKMVAPKKIQPNSNKMSLEIIERYHRNLDILLAYISSCKNVDIDKIIITSPIIAIVTYSLRDAFQFLIQHEHRHINQAVRVKMYENFPGEIEVQPCEESATFQVVHHLKRPP